MNAIKQWFLRVRSNPFFVAAWTFFAGAFGSELVSALESHTFVLSANTLESMAASALGTMTAALIHLYIIPQNPTVPATFPPSPQVEQVAAKLEPVNPAAVPVPPAK